MSSSSDIEKLFDVFGGDATAYQEIGRENEARAARKHWPLLVTLDLTQPQIPPIVPGAQRRDPASVFGASKQTLSSDSNAETGPARPKDAPALNRAKEPLFVRSHRRNIPPVVVAAPVAAPSGAARFAAVPGETTDLAAAGASANAGAAAGQIPSAVEASVRRVEAVVTPVVAAVVAGSPAVSRSVAPAVSPAVSSFATPLATSPAIPPVVAPRAAHVITPAPFQPQSASILGKLFATEPQPASAEPATASAAPASLLSVFERLRGGAGPATATPAAHAAQAAHAVPVAHVAPATPATPASYPARPAAPAANAWLVNGPLRS